MSASAQLYWDSNGGTAGAGVEPTGTWGTDAFWSTSAAGDVATGGWTDGSAAIFAAGTDATGTYTVAVNGTQNPIGINFEEGTVALSGGTLDFTSDAFLDVASGLTATIGSALSGSVLLYKSGDGTLVLTDPSPGYTPVAAPGFSVLGGTLRMGASGNILASALITVNTGTTLDLNDLSVGIGSLAGLGAVSLGSGTLTNLGVGANSRHDGIISGTGGLVKTGTNTLTLTGLNTFTGKTVILGGVLSLQRTDFDIDVLGPQPATYVADQLTIDGGALNFPTTSPLAITNNRGIYLGESGGAITMAGSKAPAIFANITGPGALLKSSVGNMSLYGTNSFAGGLTILAGGVRFNSDYAAGTGTITVNPNAGVGVFLRNLTPPGNATTVTNAIIVIGGSGFADLNAALPDTFIISGPISGAGPLVRGQQPGSSGYVVLSGDNSGWSGGLTLWRGKLALGHRNALGTTALTIRPASNANPAANIATVMAWTPLTGADAVATPISIDITNSGAHFAFAGTNALEFSGAVSLGTVAPIITVTNSGGTILSGPVGGGTGVGFTKEGVDTLTVSGVNTYDGGTTVNAGTLLVNAPGSLAGGGVVVNSGGTLGGSGTINGAVTVQSGGSVGAGASAGTLTLANGLDLSAGGTNVWELAANSTGTPGTDFDQIVLTGGTLTLGGSSTLKIAFTGTATAPDSGNPFWQSPRSWTVISAAGAASNFAAIENGTYPAGTFSTAAGPGGIVLTFTPGTGGPTPVTSFSITPGTGGNLNLNYSGGSGSQFVLLQTNNVAAPLSLWTRIQTNSSPSGSFVVTPGSDPQQFYRIKSE